MAGTKELSSSAQLSQGFRIAGAKASRAQVSVGAPSRRGVSVKAVAEPVVEKKVSSVTLPFLYPVKNVQRKTTRLG